jgi:hypothetical protein
MPAISGKISKAGGATRKAHADGNQQKYGDETAESETIGEIQLPTR